MTHLQVKKSPDGRAMARRTDGLPLTLEDRDQARKMIEAECTNPGINVDDVLNIFFTEEERHGWRYLVVKRPEKHPEGPVTIGPGRTVVDVSKFAEATIVDLVVYMAAKNARKKNWMKPLIDEKLAYLRLCGVEAEIRPLQQPHRRFEEKR